MSIETSVVSNNKVAEAKSRAVARGATDIKEEKLNGKTKLTITYPPLDPQPDNNASNVDASQNS